MNAPDNRGRLLAIALERIEAAAPERDQTSDDLREEIGWLRSAGALVDAMPQALTGVRTWCDEPLDVVNFLRALGRASLAVGRLFEGHVNAAQLISLYGTDALNAATLKSVAAGGFLGVWGADGSDPVHAEATADGVTLRGSKIFCSGLGLVTTAIISATLNGQLHLFAVDVSDAARADHTQWRVSGMRSTRSGGYDFTGISVPPSAMMGKAGDYYIEPYFLGGMYRMCAVQVGGLEALVREVAVSLRNRGKAGNPLLQQRVGGLACLVSMAISVTERLAQLVAGPAEPSAVGREAILAREGVERCAVDALAVIERSLGTELHREAARTSLIRRDLSFYIRQAAVDERLASVGAWYLRGADSQT